MQIQQTTTMAKSKQHVKPGLINFDTYDDRTVLIITMSYSPVAAVVWGSCLA
jgi:hypothetical protein